jgi:hypothetical protein
MLLPLALALSTTTTAQAGKNCFIKGGFGGWTSLDFESAASMDEDEARRAALAKRDPSPTSFGGVLYVRLNRKSIEAGDTKWQLVIVETESGELLRHQASSSIANLPALAGGPWTNLVLVPLPADIPGAFTVHVVDALQERRCTFSVDGDKVKSLTKAAER